MAIIYGYTQMPPKKGGRVGVAVNVPKLPLKKKARISDQLSVYTGELMAE